MFEKQKIKRLITFYTTKQWDKLYRYAERYKKSPQDELKYEAYRYNGLGLYKQRKYREAAENFKELTGLVNFRTDWFNLSMSYSQDGDVEKAEASFKNIYASPPIPGYKHQVTIPMMLQLYASVLAKQKAWDEALHRVTELKQMYIAANTDDEQKLSNAGLPPLNSFFQLASLVLKQFPQKDMQAWFGEIKRLKPFFDDML